MEIVYFRFQFIVEHGFESGQFGIHDDNGGCDPCFAKVGTFIGYGHCQIVSVMFLKGFGYFVRTCSISRRFHHAHHFSFRFEHRAVMIQVGYHSSQVYFQDGFVYFQFQFFRNEVETEVAGAFYQDDFISEFFNYI